MRVIFLVAALIGAFFLGGSAKAQMCIGFGSRSAECQCVKLGYDRAHPQFLECMNMMMLDGARRRQSFQRSLNMMATPPPAPAFQAPRPPVNCTTQRVGTTLHTQCY